MHNEIILYSIFQFIFAFCLIYGALTNNIALCIEAGSFLIAAAIHIEGLRICKELNK